MIFIQENAYLILLNGCSLVEDFNNFRLCGFGCIMPTRNFQLLNTWHENFMAINTEEFLFKTRLKLTGK